MITPEQIDDIITRLESGESRDSIDADLGLSPDDWRAVGAECIRRADELERYDRCSRAGIRGVVR